MEQAVAEEAAGASLSNERLGIVSDQSLKDKFHANMLITRGVVLVKLAEKEVAAVREAYAVYRSAIPEMLEGTITDEMGHDYTAGGFGAFNLPSAYHNKAACECDHMMIGTIEPILTVLANDRGYSYIEALPDRLVYRTKKQPAESWHTDNSSGARTEDEIYLGSFVNLNETKTQSFVCVPKTHKFEARLVGGDYSATKDKEKLDEYKRTKVEFSVPAGYALLWFENIVHRVGGGRHDLKNNNRTPVVPVIRKFLGFRVSNDSRQWYPDNVRRMQDQDALVPKGGKVQPMFPKMYLSNHPDKLTEYARHFPSKFQKSHTYKSGAKKAGETITTPLEHLPSLREQGCMYELSNEDKARFEPRRVCGTKRKSEELAEDSKDEAADEGAGVICTH